MTNEKLYLLEVACSVLKGSTVLYLMDDIDYSDLFATAAAQDMTSVLCEGLKSIALPPKADEALKQISSVQNKSYRDFRAFSARLAEHGVDALPVGGAALRGLYSEPLRRESYDFDTVINPADRERVVAIAESVGYVHVRECKNVDFFFKKPSSRLAVYTSYYGLNLMAKALPTSKQSVKALSPEDTYITALYRISAGISEGRGQLKRLMDIFALNFAFDQTFNRRYIESEAERLGITGLDNSVRELYNAVFLKQGNSYDSELLEKFYAAYQKKLPPRFVSPEKLALRKRIRNIILIVAAVATVTAGICVAVIFGNSRGGSDKSEEPASSEVSRSDGTKTEDGTYYGELSGGVPNGNGRLEYANGDIYEGMFAAGLPDGNGKYSFANGETYEGAVSAGKITGDGTYTYIDGSIITGSFLDKLPNGSCTAKYYDSETDGYSVFTGTMTDGLRQGDGVFEYANGDRYEGNFTDGAKSGNGTYKWASGAEFTGTWLANFPSEGTYTDTNGKYTGSFEYGKFSGDGVYYYANGDIYRGKFKSGQASDDNGELTYKSGGSYTGAFRKGVFEGYGTLVYKNGDKVRGNFTSGKLNGDAEYYYSEQKIWQTVEYKDGVIVEYKDVVD